MDLKEVVIVEGKNDTKKIKKIFPNIETFETNGYDLTKEKINLLKEINNYRGIICFLDPDYIGKKIRNSIIHEIPSAKHAFISLDDIPEKNKKKGIAEAYDEAIKKALNNFFYSYKEKDLLKWDEYLELNLNTKKKRIKICKKLNIPYYNHKQLFSILRMIGINMEYLIESKDFYE